ncbi:MAG: DUF371 domain-containing protein [Candidatus Baldrarchaeota archaeon]|nr:DUF371 domain-containing protein [Candidatus Baldrarchaeota archaeon]
MALRVVEEIRAYGHPNIRATHRSTLEITKEENLTPRGDCIIAIKANKGLYELSNEFKKIARKDGSKIKLIIEVEGLKEEITGYGSSKLTLNHPTDIVCRKSSYTCSRTLMIKANKAAIDLNREIIKKLKNPDTPVKIILIAELSE